MSTPRATPLELRIHRYQLSALMTEGEMILLGMSLNGETVSLGGDLTLECIEANERCLRLAFLDWHGDMPQDRRQALFRQLFHDAKPAA